MNIGKMGRMGWLGRIGKKRKGILEYKGKEEIGR
jgi:hypothetical protein